jgi:type IV secretion system protein VirD4
VNRIVGDAGDVDEIRGRREPLQVGGALAVILCLAYTIHAVIRWRSLREYSDIHGSARWAKRSDIKQAGLINQEGVYVGEWTNGSRIYTLRHNGPEHVLCYAPPRSGKGVGLVVPTMLTWPHSAVVTDLKREIYELTVGWRGTQGKYRNLRFEPASSTTPWPSTGLMKSVWVQTTKPETCKILQR